MAAPRSLITVLKGVSFTVVSVHAAATFKTAPLHTDALQKSKGRVIKAYALTRLGVPLFFITCDKGSPRPMRAHRGVQVALSAPLGSTFVPPTEVCAVGVAAIATALATAFLRVISTYTRL